MEGKTNKCKTIILCGGKGSRLKSLGKKIPKALVQIDGKSVLYHKMSQSVDQGFDDFILGIGYKGEMIVQSCDEMDLDFKIEFSDSGLEAGMLRRIYDTQKKIDRRVIVTYGDSLSNLSLNELMDYHIKKQGLITIVSAPIQSPFGLITMDDENKVHSLTEKPVLDYYVGTFVMEKQTLDIISEEMVDLSDGTGLIDLFQKAISLGELYTFPHEGHEITFNTVEELSEAKEGFLKFYTHFQ
jgi:glucose-1-phosphate cytidylyltransferase